MSNAQSTEKTGKTGSGNTGAPLQVKPLQPRSIEAGDRHWYWVGLTKDCILQNVAIGGVSFMQRRARMEYDERNRRYQRAGWLPGDLVRLSDKQVEGICKSAAGAVVRVVTNSDGEPVRAMKLSTQTDDYRLDETDTPLAQFMYLHRVPAEQRGHEIPPTLYRPGKDD